MDWPTAVNACDSPQIKKEALRLTRREKGGNDSKVCWNQTIRELGKLEGRLRQIVMCLVDVIDKRKETRKTGWAVRGVFWGPVKVFRSPKSKCFFVFTTHQPDNKSVQSQITVTLFYPRRATKLSCRFNSSHLRSRNPCILAPVSLHQH